MPEPLDLAVSRQQQLTRLAEKTGSRGLALWYRGMGADFDASWLALTGPLTALATAGQVAAAATTDRYLARLTAADGSRQAAAGTVEPDAFAGVDASGRDLDGLLYNAVVAAKTAVGAGAGVQGGLIQGATLLAVLLQTAVLDTGRSADLTGATARRYTHYVRMIQPGACSRCAILAGTASAQTPFLRHPRCRCTAMPLSDISRQKLGHLTDPHRYFESLEQAEQDRIFTRAGAEAIRAGADPIAVVSARRGAVGIDYSRAVLDSAKLREPGRRLVRTVIGRKADGTPVLGYTTGEGTTSRGAYARRQVAAGARTRKVGTRYSTVQRIRLMPETIIDLTDDVTMRQVLLRDAGYLDVPLTRAEMSSPLGGGYAARRAAVIRQDRATADAFYQRLGIDLG